MILDPQSEEQIQERLQEVRRWRREMQERNGAKMESNYEIVWMLVIAALGAAVVVFTISWLGAPSRAARREREKQRIIECREVGGIPILSDDERRMERCDR